MSYIIHPLFCLSFFFFFNDTATTEIYTLSLHDALPIFQFSSIFTQLLHPRRWRGCKAVSLPHYRSEEHTSELQSPDHLVCRLLLEKKKKNIITKIRSKSANSLRSIAL